MWVVSGNVANLIIAIICLGFLHFLFIHRVDFHGFIDIDIPGLILFLIFVFLYEELLSSLLFIPLNNLLINPKGKFHYIRYISGLIHLGDLIFNIIL